MIKSKLILSILCVQSALFAMNKKEELAEYLHNTLKDQTIFTKEEEGIFLTSINMLKNDASIWQLMGMRYSLRKILENKKTSNDEKCTCGESHFSHNEQLEAVNSSIQTDLNNFVAEEYKKMCKKITSCVKITTLTGASFVLTYGIVLFIRAINDEI